MSNIIRIVGLMVKAPKLVQIMLNIHRLISATVPSQIFSGTGILAKNPRFFTNLLHYNNPIAH